MKGYLFDRVGLLMAVVFLAALSAGAQTTVVFQEGVNGFTGVEDTHFVRESPDENFSDALSFVVSFEEAELVGYAYVKFPNLIGSGPNQINPGATIIAATFEMLVVNSGDGQSFLQNSQIAIEVENDTWNTLGGEVPIDLPIVDLSAAFSMTDNPNDGEIFTFDAAEVVQELVDGLENNGFVMTPEVDATDVMELISSEGAVAAPKLTVETSLGTFEFEQGKNGYEGLKDAWITSEFPDQALGQEPLASFENDGEGDFDMIAIRFDDIFGDGENQIPLGTQIDNAVLRIGVLNTGDTGTLHEILPFENPDFDINTFFDEETVTFLNFIDIVLPEAGKEISEEVVTNFTLDQPVGFLEMEVTSSVQKWSDETLPNFGWLMVPEGGGNGAISVKESRDFSPKLTVTFEGGETGVSDFEQYELY